MKPTIIRNRMIYQAPHHFKSKQLGSMLSKELQEKYHKHSARVVEGDNVKVMRGEFKGIEGKVTQVSSEKNGVAIEGIKREKLKGGNVDLYIHTSNLMITSLNLEDKWRQNRLEGQKTKTPKEKPIESQKEISKPKEAPETKEKSKQINETTKTVPKPKKKITKSEKLPEKKGKQTKTAKSAKKETK
ncbi:MAG TPA: 50S ribosomal protein L24 [Nitrosopumilaceae archaeon]|nr:50S ribosomal protein L24 [Nitrosopumilaceae archaeon]